MDNLVMKWLFDQHESMFVFLSNILLYNGAMPPCIGDTIRVSLDRPDDHARSSSISSRGALSAASSPSASSSARLNYQAASAPALRPSKSNRYQNQHEMNNTVTLKIESVHRTNLKRLFQTLSIDKILFLVSCVLTEHKLIFISSDLELLSECIFALISLIYPFKWQYLFCPVLSEKYINYFSSPLPYIIGIKRYLADYYELIEKKKPSPNLVVVDLDKQEIVGSTRGLKQLPNKPTWKLKRELTRILKKSEYLMYDLNEFKHQIHSNSMNSKYRYSPSMQLINKGKNRKKAARHTPNSSDSAQVQASLNRVGIGLSKEFVYDIARGWDDALIYNAFLSFFVVFIGDWKKFYDETDPLSPRTPHHLKNTKKNKKTAQSQTSSSESSANLGGHQNMKQVFYSQEALEYLEELLQTAMFKEWYVRQRNEHYEKHQKLYGVQDMYDFALLNSTQFGGLSYTGCYEFLCQTLQSLDKKVTKYVIDTIFEFTQNTECTRNTNMIDLMSSSAATDPNTFNALLNIINYRLYNILDNNGMNHSYALMSFYLLMKLMEQSTEKIILHCIDSYVYYAYILNKYYFNENHVIKKQMKHITNKFIQLTSNLTELQRVRAQQVSSSTTTRPEHIQTTTKYAQLFAWNAHDIERDIKLLSSSSKLHFLKKKLIGIDFADLHSANLNQTEQVLMLNAVLTPAKNPHSYHVFAQLSQYQTATAHSYRKRATKQEVAMIPPFMHLHKAFAIDLFGSEGVDDYIEQLKKKQSTAQHTGPKLSGSFDDDELEDDYKQVDDEFAALSNNKYIQSYQQMCISPNEMNGDSIASINHASAISPRRNAVAADWQSPSEALLEEAVHLQGIPMGGMQRLESDQTVKSQGTAMSDFEQINEMALDGALINIQQKKKQQETPPAISVDVHNAYDLSGNPLRSKPTRKQQIVRFKQSEDEKSKYHEELEDGKSYSTELDATPQPTTAEHGPQRFQLPNDYPDDTTYDMMTLGSGDDDREDEDMLDEPPVVKFRESIKSTKTSKWEEEPLDLDSQHGGSRKSQAYSLLAFQQQLGVVLREHDSSSPDDHEEEVHVNDLAITPDQRQKRPSVAEQKDDEKVDEDGVNDDEQREQIAYTKQSTLSPSGSTPTNMTPPVVTFTQKSAQKRPRRTRNNEMPKSPTQPSRQNEAYNSYRPRNKKAKDSVKDTEDENESGMQYVIPPDSMGTDGFEEDDDDDDTKLNSDRDSFADLMTAKRKHTGTTTSSKGTKSMLTMDFEVNDLNVAPDYDFRDRSDTNKTSTLSAQNTHLSAAQPPAIGISPVSPLSPEPTMKISQFYRKRKSQSSQRKNSGPYASPSVSSGSHGTNESVGSQHREKASSVASVPESYTSVAEEVDIDLDDISSESTITAPRDHQEHNQDTAESKDNAAEQDTKSRAHGMTKTKRMSRPRLLANVDLHHSPTPERSDDDAYERSHSHRRKEPEKETKTEPEHDREESDSSSAITIELIPETEEPEQLEDMEIEKLLSVDTPVLQEEDNMDDHENGTKQKKSKKRRRKKKSSTRKKSRERKEKRKRKKRKDDHDDVQMEAEKTSHKTNTHNNHDHKPVAHSSPSRPPMISGQFNQNDVHNHHDYVFNHKRMMNGQHMNPHHHQQHPQQDMDIPPSSTAVQELNLEHMDSQQSKDSEITQQTIKISEMMLSDEEKHTDGRTEYVSSDNDDSNTQSPQKRNQARSPRLPPPPQRNQKPPPPAQPPLPFALRSKSKSKSKTPPKPYIPAPINASASKVITPTDDLASSSPFSPTHKNGGVIKTKSTHQYVDSEGNLGKLRMNTPKPPRTPKPPKRKRPAVDAKSSSDPQLESEQHLASNPHQHFKSSSNPGNLPIPARPASSRSVQSAVSHHDHNYNSDDMDGGKRAHHQQHYRDRKKRKKVEKMTEDEFNAEPLEQFIMAGGDDFDIAKRICKHFDTKFGDTDTVAIVANKGQGPKLSYWSKANYQRKNKNVHGKYVFVYRACKHVETKCLMKKEKFIKYVRKLSMEYRKPHEIADQMDSRLGEGCHVARAKHDQFDVYCRYSNGYMADVLLPNGDFIVAWRR